MKGPPWMKASVIVIGLLCAVTPLSGCMRAAPAVPLTASSAFQVIPFTQAEVMSADGRRVTIRWTAPPSAGPVTVYARVGPDEGARLVGQGGPSGTLSVEDLPPAPRWTFELRPARGGSLMVADRSLHLATAPNFRDVGGYRTADGRWVRMGLVYRSDQLDRLSPADLATIGRLGIGLVVDLRTDAERRRGLDRLPDGAQSLIEDVLASSPPDQSALLKASGPQSAADFLVLANRQFVSLPSAKTSYSALVSRVDLASKPLVYHCSAGKDRTGWATAVLLTALGVPRSTIMADYMASNGYLADKNKAMFAAMPRDAAAKLAPIFTVQERYLDAAFDEVRTRYGSFEAYLKEGLGLKPSDIAALKARLLDGAPAP